MLLRSWLFYFLNMRISPLVAALCCIFGHVAAASASTSEQWFPPILSPEAIVQYCGNIMQSPSTQHIIQLNTRNCLVMCTEFKGLLGLTTYEVDFELACQVQYPSEFHFALFICCSSFLGGIFRLTVNFLAELSSVLLFSTQGICIIPNEGHTVSGDNNLKKVTFDVQCNFNFIQSIGLLL